MTAWGFWKAREFWILIPSPATHLLCDLSVITASLCVLISDEESRPKLAFLQADSQSLPQDPPECLFVTNADSVAPIMKAKPWSGAQEPAFWQDPPAPLLSQRSLEVFQTLSQILSIRLLCC